MRECLRVLTRKEFVGVCAHSRALQTRREIAEDIRAFSAYPEEELLIPMNSCFSVQGSLSSADAALLQDKR